MPTKRLTPEPEASEPHGVAAGDSARAGLRKIHDPMSGMPFPPILCSGHPRPSGADHRRGGSREPAEAAGPRVRSNGKGTLIPASLKDEAPAPRMIGGCLLRENSSMSHPRLLIVHPDPTAIDLMTSMLQSFGLA